MNKYQYENMIEEDESELYGGVKILKGNYPVAKNKGVPQYHSTSQHNYYIRKKWLCPYCNKGSKEIIDVLYEQWMEERDDL